MRLHPLNFVADIALGRCGEKGTFQINFSQARQFLKVRVSGTRSYQGADTV
jgi:hypothetical protein